MNEELQPQTENAENNTETKQPIYKKPIFWAVAVLIFLLYIALVTMENPNKNTANTASTAINAQIPKDEMMAKTDIASLEVIKNDYANNNIAAERKYMNKTLCFCEYPKSYEQLDDGTPYVVFFVGGGRGSKFVAKFYKSELEKLSNISGALSFVGTFCGEKEEFNGWVLFDNCYCLTDEEVRQIDDRLSFEAKKEEVFGTQKSEISDTNDTAAIETTEQAEIAVAPVAEESQEEYVWVGETGTKYHSETCPTLKGGGHKIKKSEAIKQGREPCKRCGG